MKEIPLTRGKVALIDDEDFIKVSQYNWHCTKTGYAARGQRVNGKQTLIYMHRFIMNTPPENALAYDNKARSIHGEHALTNF